MGQALLPLDEGGLFQGNPSEMQGKWTLLALSVWKFEPFCVLLRGGGGGEDGVLVVREAVFV